MARLNEPPAPAAEESIDTLKRKFLRQNREIAKVNSAQAVRIRALENEVSRLLTDNLNSRGHIIRLERELESHRSRHQHVDDLRTKMEEKVAELSALFKDFNGQPSPKKRKSLSPKETNKATRPSATKSPGTKDWKNTCSLGEPMPGQESRFPPSLPAIVENKYYPRKTLEQDEIAALQEAADNTDSPELEPPPVSKFIDENPVKIDLPVKAPVPEVDVPRKSPSTTTFTTAMLDQRRKRRESVGMSDIRRLSGDETMIHESTPDSLKVGAKRKISVRDGEERPASSHVSTDDFKFTRKPTITEDGPPAVAEQENPPVKLAREAALVKTTSRDRSRLATTQTNGRKALAPKPSNDDVANSPRKKTKTPGPALDEVSLAKKDLAKPAPILERPRSRVARRNENVPPKSVQPPAVSKVDILPDPEPPREPEIAHEPEPETPAAPDVISPIFSEAPARPEIKDTPPPTNIGMESVADHGRPGRRARASVSYAEPNLRDKMRRPTKELVDAVTQKPHTYIKIEDGESNPNSTVKSSSKSVYIKPEPMDDNAWKSNPDPPSPLTGKAPVLHENSNRTTNAHDTRQKPTVPSTSTKDSDNVDRRSRTEKQPEPTKSSRTTAPPTSSSTRHSRHPAISTLDKNKSQLDIYDFQDSGEHDDSQDPNEKIRKFVREEEEAGRIKGMKSSGVEQKSDIGNKGTTKSSLVRKDSSSKRNSALPLQMQVQEASAGEESDVEGGAASKRRSFAGTGTRRRSVATVSDRSLPASNSMPEFRGSRRGNESGNSTSTSTGNTSHPSSSDSVSDKDGGARQERINARRRSMML